MATTRWETSPSSPTLTLNPYNKRGEVMAETLQDGKGGIMDIYTYGVGCLTHEKPRQINGYAYDGRGSVSQTPRYKSEAGLQYLEQTTDYPLPAKQTPCCVAKSRNAACISRFCALPTFGFARRSYNLCFANLLKEQGVCTQPCRFYHAGHRGNQHAKPTKADAKISISRI